MVVVADAVVVVVADAIVAADVVVADVVVAPYILLLLFFPPYRENHARSFAAGMIFSVFIASVQNFPF